MYNSNRENIEVYEVNIDVFSIGSQCFAFNEPASGSNLCRRLNRVLYNGFLATTIVTTAERRSCLSWHDRRRDPIRERD